MVKIIIEEETAELAAIQLRTLADNLTRPRPPEIQSTFEINGSDGEIDHYVETGEKPITTLPIEVKPDSIGAQAPEGASDSDKARVGAAWIGVLRDPIRGLMGEGIATLPNIERVLLSNAAILRLMGWRRKIGRAHV